MYSTHLRRTSRRRPTLSDSRPPPRVRTSNVGRIRRAVPKSSARTSRTRAKGYRAVRAVGASRRRTRECRLLREGTTRRGSRRARLCAASLRPSGDGPHPAPVRIPPTPTPPRSASPRPRSPRPRPSRSSCPNRWDRGDDAGSWNSRSRPRDGSNLRSRARRRRLASVRVPSRSRRRRTRRRATPSRRSASVARAR